MRYLLDSENTNVKQPERSRLLLKPLNEIKHGGGQKMLPGDITYKTFRAWLDDYTRTVNDRYANTELPSPARRCSARKSGSSLPKRRRNGHRLLQVTLFAWDIAKNTWESEPIALSDRAVWGKGKLWQHNLALLAAKNSARAKQWSQTPVSLPAGQSAQSSRRC